MNPPPFLLERYFAEHEFTAKYLFSSSDCESLPLGKLLAFEPGARAALDKLWLGYSESLGGLELRHAITALYQTIQPEEVLVHAGAQEAIFSLMNVLLSPGDHVVTQFPCYQSCETMPQVLGCSVTHWLPERENPWDWSLDRLARAIKPKTKLIVVNNPHNPTGYLMPSADFVELLRLAGKQGIYVLSDEVYRGLEYDEIMRLDAACDLYERAVSLGVMSKSYGLAGLRVGWIATHAKQVFQDMASFKDYTTICTSVPSEFLAALAIRHRERLWKENRGMIRSNLDLLNPFFETHRDRFAWSPPRTGCIAFPAIRNESAEGFCGRVVKETGVLLVPSTKFSYGNGHFRVGFGRRNMPEALRVLEEYLCR